MTDEQVTLAFGQRFLWVDIQAESRLRGVAILVEVKQIEDAASPVDAWANSVGKYILYRSALHYNRIDIPIYLAVTETAYAGILGEVIGQNIIEQLGMLVVVFDPVREEIVQWIP